MVTVDQRVGASPAASGRRTIADSFAPRHNSLNFIRLVLAVTVIFSHSILLGGYADERLRNSNLSTIALYGFFGLSGFLIVVVLEGIAWDVTSGSDA